MQKFRQILLKTGRYADGTIEISKEALENLDISKLRNLNITRNFDQNDVIGQVSEICFTEDGFLEVEGELYDFELKPEFRYNGVCSKCGKDFFGAECDHWLKEDKDEDIYVIAKDLELISVGLVLVNKKS